MTESSKPVLNCIMLVDDDEATNFLHKIFIQKTGIGVAVKVKNNGKEAYDYIHDKLEQETVPGELPGLILLDLNMPGVDGWEFLTLYSQFPGVFKSNSKVVILSSSSNPNDIRKAKEISHVVDYVIKPANSEIFKTLAYKHFTLTE